MYACSTDGNRKTCEGTTEEVGAMRKEMAGYRVDGYTAGFAEGGAGSAENEKLPTSSAGLSQGTVDSFAVSQFQIYGPQSKRNEWFGFMFQGKNQELQSAIVRGKPCSDSGSCSINTAAAAALIERGANVYGEWHTHPHIGGSRTLSQFDVDGAFANWRINPKYSAYFSDPQGNIFRWDASLRFKSEANRSRIQVGSYTK